jgi:hypothetical protein
MAWIAGGHDRLGVSSSTCSMLKTRRFLQRAERDVPRVLNFFWPMMAQALVLQDPHASAPSWPSKFSCFCCKGPKMTKYMPDGLRYQVLCSKRACLAQIPESSLFTGIFFPQPGTACTPLEPRCRSSLFMHVGGWALDRLTAPKGATKTILGARQPERRLQYPLLQASSSLQHHACKLYVRRLQ